ncbi:MAG: lipocalin family protein, partial [bacterium]
NSPVRTVSNYLEATADPMSCQGSYYYSLPLLDVEQFTITRSDSVLSSGTKGLMWMDYVVQTYDQRAVEVFSEASWSFYAIQFPDINASLMVIEINSTTGSLPIARLFSTDGGMTLNYAHKPKYIWAINNINIEAVPGTNWTSPKSNLDYAMQHRIQLMSEDFPADLTLTMVINDQEIYIDEKTIKYEGLATVEGTLGSMTVTGQAFVEIQPVGHLK